MNKFNQELMEKEVCKLNLNKMVKQMEIHGSFLLGGKRGDTFIEKHKNMEGFLEGADDSMKAYFFYLYSACVLECRWQKAEPFILKSPFWSAMYAEKIVKGKWEECEDIVLTDARYAFHYATLAIKERFLKGERLIANCRMFPELWDHYSEQFGIEKCDIGVEV